MSEIKTHVHDGDVEAFLNAVPNETRRKDGLMLLDIYKRVTGEPAKMWGTSMVGFGLYHYKSERSRQEGDWPLAAFSPRKASLSLYVLGHGERDYAELLGRLGKHKTGMGCLYINKLADVDMGVLEELIATSYRESKKKLT